MKHVGSISPDEDTVSRDLLSSSLCFYSSRWFKVLKEEICEFYRLVFVEAAPLESEIKRKDLKIGSIIGDL